MLVYLARHAWAGHYGDPGWPDDSQRPLTPEGVTRYRLVLEALVARREFEPEWIATSPYVRCQQTAELISEATGAPIDPFPALEPGADLAALCEWSATSACERVCWVGHNPDCETLLEEMLIDSNDAERFPKGSIAAVRFPTWPGPGEGTLDWHETAKRLGV